MIKNKIETIKDIFLKIDHTVDLSVEALDEETYSVCGPYPSFMLLVTEGAPTRALIHVNADAANLVYIFSEFAKKLDIEYDGAFAIVPETGKLLIGYDAFHEKEKNIVAFAEEIKIRRPELNKVGIYIPPSEIYLGK